MHDGPLPAPCERRAIRERVGISQRDVARVVGVTPMQVSRWESGSHSPKGVAAEAYASLLRVLAMMADEIERIALGTRAEAELADAPRT